MSLAIICSGGDCAGMNPAIKRFVEYSKANGLDAYLIYNGLEGLIDNEIKEASFSDVSGIISKGGTIIGSSRSKRFYESEYRKQAFENLQQKGIETLIVLGGDGSFRAMQRFYDEYGLGWIGIPSTIDNDIALTQYTLGVDTALNIIRNAIDGIRDTAASFKRGFVIETMGRECGYLALVSALTSGAEFCLIPEANYDLNSIEKRLKDELDKGRGYVIGMVSEALDSQKIVKWMEDDLGIEARLTILGHIQRGGNPTVFDRLMAYEWITFAIDNILQGNISGVAIYHDGKFALKPIAEVSNTPHQINPTLLENAKRLFK